jgi:hypothetical protein
MSWLPAVCVSVAGSRTNSGALSGSAVSAPLRRGIMGLCLATLFKMAFDRLFPFFFCGLLFLLEFLLYSAVPLLVVELAKIVCFTLHVDGFAVLQQ